MKHLTPYRQNETSLSPVRQPGAVAGLRHRGLLQVRDARYQRRPGAHHVAHHV